MLFNSLTFLVFFVVVFLSYFALPKQYRWILLLAASYYFYAYWNIKYTVLILVTTVSSYASALYIDACRDETRRKLMLSLLVVFNLGILAVFKYFNFLTNSINTALEQMHVVGSLPVLDILLPVGISFYTFQAIGYVVDVYRRDIGAEKNLGIFALYVSFFPQLVAGPIERSRHLLPQLRKSANFDMDRIASGLTTMTWGFFKKIVIADRVGLYVDYAYTNSPEATAWQLLLATFFFAFQIYCDFSGYSDIAIGCARVFGVDLMRNFNSPYFSRSIQEFWRRWHISLSTWFRDYLYIPLGGSRVGSGRLIFNVMAVFLLCGLWHGANWTFVVWGGLHGLLLVVQHLLPKKRLDLPFVLRNAVELAKLLGTFTLVCLAWVFFRARDLQQAWDVILRSLSFEGAPESALHLPTISTYECRLGLIFIAILLILELWKKGEDAGHFLASKALPIRWGTLYFLFFTVLIFGEFKVKEFIYFQF